MKITDNTKGIPFNNILKDEGTSIVLEALGYNFKGFKECPKCKHKNPNLKIEGFEHRYLSCNEIIGKKFFNLFNKKCDFIFLMDEDFFDEEYIKQFNPL